MNDDRPVGGGGLSAKTFSAAADPAEDFSKLSLDQLLTNANWKARKEGYDRITKDPKKYRSTFFDKIAKVAVESNAAAQESLFDALVALVPVCDGDERGLLCQAPLSLVVEKGLTGRPKAVASGQDFATLLVEYGKQNEVFDTLLPAFTHKAPKNRQAAAQLCSKLVSDFGTQHFPVKAILKAMQPLFNDANPQVRKEAIALCCQCYKYIGAGIKGFLTDLREVQLQELEKQFESVTLGGKPPKQIKGTASPADGRRGSTAAPQAIGSLTGDGGPGAIDDAAFELLDESPVIPRLPKKFFATALDKNTPWQDRCEYVTNSLMPLLSAPRLRAGEDYHELAAMMKAYLTDPQAPLMLLGFQMVQECARGLRGGFSSYAKMYISPLFDKMKDKKTSVLLHISATLEKLIRYHCITMDQCNEEMEQVSQSKNPSQRIALVHFCIRMVDQLDSSRYQRLGRSVNMLKRMVNDEKSENRDAGYLLLGKLVTALGEAPYKAVFASMDDKQKSRMQIVLAAPETHAGGHNPYSSAAPTPKNNLATPSNSPAKKLPRVEALGSSRSGAGGGAASTAGPAVAARRISSAHGARATTGSARSSTQHAPGGRSTVHGAGARSGVAVTPSLDDPVSLESTLPPRMEAANHMLGLLNGDTGITDLLRSHEWSQRLDGMLKVKGVTDQWDAQQSTKYYNTLVVFLRATPGFKESTFQVFQAELNVLNETLSKTTSITPGAGYAIVAGCTPRLTEMKNRQPIRDMCSRIGQRLGYRFVIHHMILVVKEVKTPKLMQECNDYFNEVVAKCATGDGGGEDPSEDRLDVRGMMDYIKRPCFEQTAPPVRAASMQLLLALNRYDTTGVHQWIQTFPQQVITQFQQQALSPSTTASRRGSVDRPISTSSAGDSRTTTGGGGPPLLPRPRPSSLASTTRSSTAVTAAPADGPQKRYRASSQSPGPGARARPSTGPGGGGPPTPSRMSQRVRSSSARNSGTLGGRGGPGSATNRTPLDRSLDAGTPRASEVPSVLRPIIREITNGLDWRDRLDAVRQIDEYMDKNNDTLPPGSVGPVLKALGTRFEEANKNFVVDVLRTILRVVEVGGPEESRGPLRRIVPGALAMLGDQKTMLREEARKVVFLGMDVCGLDMLLQALQRPLGSDSNIARQNTLEAMVHGFENQSPGSPPVSRAGLQLLVPPVVKALMDRIQEVRFAAEQVIGYFLPIMGDEPILRHVQLLKPAEQQAVMPAIERQLGLHTPVNTSTALVAVNDNEEEDQEDDEAPVGRRAGLMSPSAGQRSPTPVGTPRRAGQLTPRRGTTPHSRRGSFTPRTASLASQAASTANHPNAALGSSNPNLNNSTSNFSLPTHSQAAPGTPSKSSARRPSISVSQQQQQQQQQQPPPQPPQMPPSTDPHAGTHTTSNTETATSTPSPSARGGRKETGPKDAKAHQRQAVVKDHAAVTSKESEQMYSIAEIQIGLRSATPQVAYSMCTDFMKHLQAGEDCGTPEMMQGMVERLHENTQKLEPELALGLIGCLSAMYTSPRSAQRCHSNLIFRLVGTIFDCLLSEQFSLNENVLKSLNAMTLKMLEGCPANDVFSALMSRMTSYSTTYLQTSRKADLKYIQVTVKCVMRVDLEQVASDNVILCCHEYLLQHPPSAFRNLDDLPIRTVKTILQTVTRRYGQELLKSADRLVGPQNLVTHFIRACLENRDRTASHAAASGDGGDTTPTVRSQRENNERHAVEESIQQQRASQSPAPKAPQARTTTPVRGVPAHAGNATPKRSPVPQPPTQVTATSHPSAPPHPQQQQQQQQPKQHVDPNASSTPVSRSSTGVYVASKNPPANLDKRRTQPPAAVTATATTTGGGNGASPPPRHPTAAPAAPPAPVTAPVPTPAAPAEPASLSDIFTHIRHHTTSQQGIDELYVYLKSSPANCEDEFNHQFLRCSEAFRLYIKRKLDRKTADDPSPSSSFSMPSMLAELSS